MVMTSASSFQLSLSRVWMHGAFTILCVLYENKEFVDDLLNSHPSSSNAARSSLIEEIHDSNEQKPAFPPSFYTEPLLGLCSLPSILLSAFVTPHLQRESPSNPITSRHQRAMAGSDIPRFVVHSATRVPRERRRTHHHRSVPSLSARLRGIVVLRA